MKKQPNPIRLLAAVLPDAEQGAPTPEWLQINLKDHADRALDTISETLVQLSVPYHQKSAIDDAAMDAVCAYQELGRLEGIRIGARLAMDILGGEGTHEVR